MKRLQKMQELNGDVQELWPRLGADQRQDQPNALSPMPATDRDVDRLHDSIEELQEALEKADRRINRLIGEKKQLKLHLEKRDLQLEQLNRELGGHSLVQQQNVPKPSRPSVFRDFSDSLLVSAFNSMTARFRRHSPSSSDDVAASLETAGTTKGRRQPLYAGRPGVAGQQVVVILLLGLEQDQVEHLLPIIERDFSPRDMMPLFVVDTDAFELFRSRSLVFEYFPPVSDRDRFDSTLHWDLYSQRRLALIRRKWAPVRIISFGDAATRMLALWSGSPFEDTPLPAVVNEAATSR